MQTPLLTTKLYTPPYRPELIPRPRLIQRLNAGLQCRLTLISAPAGFGKTTLIAEWLHSVESYSPPPHIAWLSLDAEDNDSARFFTYFVAALETVRPGAGADARAMLQSPKPPPPRSVLTLLINELTAFSEDLVLVLDDYHFIEEDAIHTALGFLLDHMPPHMHLVIASRVDPPLPLARLRTRGQLLELREADLRFTQDEAGVFLNQAMGINLSPGDVAALEARTEGWVAGLQLAALSMRGRASQHIPAFITAFSGSHRHVIDYLAEEVMALQTKHIHDFLCQTAILDRFSAPLCDALTGREDSNAILRGLESSHLFLVPLDDERRWYRYHRLFADFLRSHLHQDMPACIPDLHRRAARWYQQHQLIPEAIGHALDAADFEQAADLVEQTLEATMMRSEIATLQSWIEALPEDVVRTRPLLCVYHAWALLLSGHPLEAAEARLVDAVEADARGSVAGEVALFRALIAIYKRDTLQSAEQSQRALSLLPEGNLFLRSLVAGFLGVNYLWQGDIVAARRTLDEAARLSQKAGNVMNAVLALCHLAEVSMIRAQLFEAQAFYKQALELAVDEQAQPRPIAGMALIGLGGLLREWNDLDSAERHLLQGIELLRRWGEVGSISGYGQLARLKQTQGDMQAAYQALQRAQHIARDFDATESDDRLVDAYQARLWISQGNLEAAIRWAEAHGLSGDVELDLPEREDGPVFIPLIRAIEYLTLIELHLAHHQPDKALHVLEPMLRATHAAGWTGFVLQLLIFRALALQAQGDVSGAINALERALSLAEPGGFVRTFVDAGRPMPVLLQQAASRGSAPAYAARLLAAFEAEPGAEGLMTKETSAPLAPRPSRFFPGAGLLVEPLSERELEVLRLIAVGLSNREIADSLVIALSTVKTHINNIYRKLDVSKRTQAVARARELDLL